MNATREALTERLAAAPKCLVDGCDKPRARGKFCVMHKHRYYRYGHPLAGAAFRGGPIEVRFWEKVSKTEACWNWVGRTRAGYGMFDFSANKEVSAHRFSYEILVGSIPGGMEVDHLCLNKRCVNPDHLEPVTKKENMARWAATITRCKNGHEFSPENTYYKPSGHRECKMCRRDADRRRSPRQRSTSK